MMMTLNDNWSREGGESRTEEYRSWRTRLGVGAVGDVDQVEYSGGDGRPLIMVELCVADRRSEECPAGIAPGMGPSPRFFEQVEKKVSEERPQGRLVRHLSAALGVPSLLVVYIRGELAAGVWVKRSDRPASAWEALTIAEYEDRLRRLHTR